MKALVCVLGLFIACGCAEPSSSTFAGMDSSTNTDIDSSVTLEDAGADSEVDTSTSEVADTGAVTDTGTGPGVDTVDTGEVIDTGTGPGVDTVDTGEVIDTGTGPGVDTVDTGEVIDTGTGPGVDTGEVIDTGTGPGVDTVDTGTVTDTTTLVTDTGLDTGLDTGVPTDTCWSIDTGLNQYVYVCGTVDTGIDTGIDTGSIVPGDTDIDTASTTETESIPDTATEEIVDPDCALNVPMVERFDIDERPAGWDGIWCWGNTSTDPEVDGGYMDFSPGCNGASGGEIRSKPYYLTGCNNVTVSFDYVYIRPTHAAIHVSIMSMITIEGEDPPDAYNEEFHLIPYVSGNTWPLPVLPAGDRGTVKAYVSRENLLPGATFFVIQFLAAGPSVFLKFDNVEVRNER